MKVEGLTPHADLIILTMGMHRGIGIAATVGIAATLLAAVQGFIQQPHHHHAHHHHHRSVQSRRAAFEEG